MKRQSRGMTLDTYEERPLYFVACIFLKKNLNASKPYQSKGLGGNIGCRDKSSAWY